MWIAHHGILKQKWGVRHGPPYPLSGGKYSPAEKKAIYKERRKKYSIYNKKHFDQSLEKGTVLTTLSFRPDRTKKPAFFASHVNSDNHWYNAFFNKSRIIDGKELLKYRIDNKAKRRIDIASEDSGREIFRQLYSKDRDFYNFVTDKDRMRKIFNYDNKQWKGYKQADEVLKKLDEGKEMTEEDVNTMYRTFNYILAKHDKDVINQRTKFFNIAKEKGYEALLDTNDGVYGGYKTKSPLIIIDPEAVALKNIERTTTNSKRFSALVALGSRAIGV